MAKVRVFEGGLRSKSLSLNQKALAVDPDNVDAYNGWGNALRDQGRLKAAEEKFAKAREHH